ncbi:MAG: PD-(D/E)XK nuclease family protein [Bacillota bacterium]
MQVFSPSRLEKFATCPAAGYRKYVLELPEPATEAQNVGKAAHAVIAQAIKERRADPEFFESLCSAVGAACGVDSGELLKLTYNLEVLNCAALARKVNARVEEHFQFPLDPDDPFGPELQGYVDFWAPKGSEVLLVDWKSGYKVYSPLEKYQLGLYAWRLHQETGKPVRGKLVFLRKGVFEHLYTPEDGIEEAHTWALQTARDVQERLHRVQQGGDPREHFPASPGPHCKYCGWAADCAGGEISLPGQVATREEAEKVARDILRLEGALDSLEKSLRAYVEKHGPVTVDGKEFRLLPSRYWKWPQEALKNAVAAMQEEGIDPLTVLSLTSAGLKKLGWDEERCRTLGADLAETLQFRCISARGK